ncbi:MAG: HAD family hydrolase [Clostridiales bacterium]|nr:HAD family hydrolase [Clostridiales bacterium]
MPDTLTQFTKKKDFLVCVDSDGCAMDTMDIKHIRCFGPCMVDEWNLNKWREEILTRWNEINLYSMTRGINRFKGLALMLREIHENYCSIDDLEALETWVNTTPELSNDALEREIRRNQAQECSHVCLEKALSWSKAVNNSIKELTQEDKKPFEGVEAALALIHQQADVAVVSSANIDAVMEEWVLYGLLGHTDLVLAQDAGSKAHCIEELVKKGYDKDHILMCGDAPGDLSAAQKNGVYYYPILVKHEKESWAELASEGFARLLEGSYGGTYQQEKIEAFTKNLGN